jgi:iron complex transport system substrate-binding protein
MREIRIMGLHRKWHLNLENQSHRGRMGVPRVSRQPLCWSRLSQRPAGATTRPAAQRIISIAPDATEIIAALGQTRRLVAVCTFCVWPPEIKGLPRVGGLFDASAETILKLRPDLIILRGANKNVEQACAEGNIRLFRDRTERFDDIYKTLGELGDLLGSREQAVAVARDMDARLEKIARAVGGRPQPKVLMTLARRPDALGEVMTGSKTTFIHEIIVRAGGENAFADMSLDYPRIGPEAVLAARPEVIVEAMPESPPSPTLQENLRDQWRRLGPIPAVQSNRVYVLTDDHCLIPSPRIVDIIAKVARLLHPEAHID